MGCINSRASALQVPGADSAPHSQQSLLQPQEQQDLRPEPQGPAQPQQQQESTEATVPTEGVANGRTETAASSSGAVEGAEEAMGNVIHSAMHKVAEVVFAVDAAADEVDMAVNEAMDEVLEVAEVVSVDMAEIRQDMEDVAERVEEAAGRIKGSVVRVARRCRVAERMGRGPDRRVRSAQRRRQLVGRPLEPSWGQPRDSGGCSSCFGASSRRAREEARHGLRRSWWKRGGLLDEFGRPPMNECERHFGRILVEVGRPLQD